MSPNHMKSIEDEHKPQFHSQGKFNSMAFLNISVVLPHPLTTYGLLFTELPEKAFTNSNQIFKKTQNQIRSCYLSAPNPPLVPHPTPHPIHSEMQISLPFHSPCDMPPPVWPTPLLSTPPSTHSAPDLLLAALSLANYSPSQCLLHWFPWPQALLPEKAYDSPSYLIQVSAPRSPPQRGFLTIMYHHHTIIFPSLIFLLSTQHPGYIKCLSPAHELHGIKDFSDGFTAVSLVL